MYKIQQMKCIHTHIHACTHMYPGRAQMIWFCVIVNEKLSMVNHYIKESNWGPFI